MNELNIHFMSILPALTVTIPFQFRMGDIMDQMNYRQDLECSAYNKNDTKSFENNVLLILIPSVHRKTGQGQAVTHLHLI